jgi:hypothetical protein
VTDRISIPALRDGAKDGRGYRLYGDELLALVEAVEAAREVVARPQARPGMAAKRNRLRDALARFDFGEQA